MTTLGIDNSLEVGIEYTGQGSGGNFHFQTASTGANVDIRLLFGRLINDGF